jgi:hypothetical protein
MNVRQFERGCFTSFASLKLGSYFNLAFRKKHVEAPDQLLIPLRMITDEDDFMHFTLPFLKGS